VFRRVSYTGNAADLLQNRAWAGSFHVTHYTSKNLADWQFESFLPNASSFGKSRYDSVVFRIKDGRFILVSAGNAPPNLQSYDLHSWQVVNDSSLKCGFGAAEFPTTCTDEGPHATRWNGKLWFNMEPRECDQSSDYLRPSSDCYARASSLTLAGYHTAGCDDTTSTRTHCQNKSVLCSDDGGESFKNQPFNIFEDNAFSTRYLDDGQAHQGPLLGQGSRALVMYFAENVYSLGSDMASINNQRSVLQVAPVVESADGWLHANRSGHVPLPLLPPDNVTMIDRGPILPQMQPTTWHVKAEDAMIIAAAELNRWTPRWCPDEDSSHELLPGYKLHAAPFCTTYTKDSAACVAACANNDTCAAVVVTTGAACTPPRPMDPSGIQLNTQALAELFSSAKVDTALECKALCVKTKGCGSLVFRHKGSSPGEGACGAVNETCCYLLHDTNPKMIPHAGWDAWAKGGSASSCSGAGIKPTHSSACCSFVSQTALDRESDLDVMIHNTSSWAKEGILTSTVMPWRDQTRVGRYFETPAHSGADPYGWVWNLRTSSNLRHRVTQRPLQFSFRISANGTILSMANLTTSPARPMAPLRQFRRDSWSPMPPPVLAAGGGSSLLKTDDDHFVASCPLNVDDCTGELMAALNRPGVSTVIVPSYPRAVWPVTPLEMGNAASNRRVVFRPGLTIEAKRGAFQGGADSLLMCRNLENVSFEGSGGATFLMHRSDYANSSLYNHSESRMGVELHGCRNVSLSGLNINSTVSGANT
jgi:hypothetical protein